MAVKKKGKSSKKAINTRKTARPKKSRTPSVFKELKKVLAGLLILLAICLTAAMIADILLKPDRVEKKKPLLTRPEQIRKPAAAPRGMTPAEKKKKTEGLKAKSEPQVAEHPITYEVYKDIPPVMVPKPVIPPKDHIPRIALIIDDIGYDKKMAAALFELDNNITFSILPFSPFARTIAETLNQKNALLMLHLPMEPLEYPEANPGPGAILSSMPPDVLLEQLKKDIQQVPHISGVNNHMGSELTRHANQMNQIFTILKKKDLFFIDSRTASKSQGEASARLLKLKFAQRDVFLDNIQEETYITGQLNELIRLAKKHGSAIGIGHPYKATLQTLSKELPQLKGKIKIVRADTLTTIPQ